jgi:hypothetical protein
VQEVEPLDNLAAPRLEDALVDLLEPAQVRLERAGRHQLRHQDDALLRPGTNVLGFVNIFGLAMGDF